MSEAARALPIGRLLYYLREALGEALQNVLRTARGNQSYPPRDENFKVTELIDDLQRCHTAILILCDLFIVSPERPLCKEIVDLCRKHNITSRFNVLAANSGPVVTNTPPQVIESWRRSLEALWLGEVRDRVNYYGKKGLSVKDTMSMFLRWKATTHITVEKVVHRILQEYCALSDGEDVYVCFTE